jgi:hypothetical protein
VRVEAVAVRRLVRAVDPVPVELPRPDVGEVRVPDHVGAPSQWDPLALDGVVGPIEHAERDRRCVLREDREVDTFPVPRGALRVWRAGPDPERRHSSDLVRDEEQARERRQHDLDRSWTPLRRNVLGLDASEIAYAAPPVLDGIAVQRLPPRTHERDIDARSLARDRREVAGFRPYLRR